MKRLVLIVLVLCGGGFVGFGQGDNEHRQFYEESFEELLEMASGEIDFDFKRAVFVTENAYHNGGLSYDEYESEIEETGNRLRKLISENGLDKFKTAGNWAVYVFMIDSLPVNNYAPCVYDFEDFMGNEDWTNMFVSKLMRTKGGNCHSLPYYYKILCEEIGAEASLALAPNHIYIKHVDENGQWTNLELTNGGFPRDQWIIKQMAISVEAIKNEIYMTPLSEMESVAMTMFDLASAYEVQFGMDSFYLRVVNSGLFYFPNCVPLLMCKVNYYGRIVKEEQEKARVDYVVLKEAFDMQEGVHKQISDLGHKDMPSDLYEEWVKSVEEEKEKRGVGID